MDITEFRLAFPEFADETKYPDPMITFWSSAADLLLNETRWGTLYTHGIWLFTAHNIILASADVASADSGAYPGAGIGGLVSNKGVDGVSIGYDTGATRLEGAGNYNMTKYGRELWWLMNLVGMGGYQV